MANAATFADLAIILIDVKEELLINIKAYRNCKYVSKHKEIVFCVNKMDLINYNKEI